MAEEEDYEVKSVERKVQNIEAKIDQKIQEDVQSEPLISTTPQSSQTAKRGFPLPNIPTEKIFKTITDKELMMQAWHDETLEPHIHLMKLLLIVFVLAIIITLIGI